MLCTGGGKGPSAGTQLLGGGLHRDDPGRRGQVGLGQLYWVQLLCMVSQTAVSGRRQRDAGRGGVGGVSEEDVERGWRHG